jgi:putative toxin-antitoxin system antitoxin component (TIGR02293 family)
VSFPDLFAKAVDAFDGDLESAARWLTTPKEYLGSKTPLSYAKTEAGAREVENLLGRLEHGIYS